MQLCDAHRSSLAGRERIFPGTPKLCVDCNIPVDAAAQFGWLVLFYLALALDTRADKSVACHRAQRTKATDKSSSSIAALRIQLFMKMKLFGNWFGFIAMATGAAHFIFAIDSNSIATDKSPPDKDTSGKGRASYIWEKRVSPPYPYQQQYHPYKTLVTPVQPSNAFTERVQSQHRIGPEHLKSDFRPTVTSRLPTVAITDDQRLGRDGISPKKSYGYSHSGGGGHHSDHGTQHYYAAQPLPYYPATKEHSFGIGSFGFFKPLFLILILPFFLLIFFVAVVYVVRIVAASSSTAAVALTQQQQQQQDSNNNNNNNNANNDNNNNAIVLSSSTGSFVITINATGRANRNNFFDLIKSPAPLFNWHNSYHRTSVPTTVMNETWLLA